MQQVKAQNISSNSGGATGQSLLFDGNSTLSRQWDKPPTNAAKFTVSFWTKRAETDVYQYIMSSDGIDELAFASADYGDPEGSIKSVYQYGEAGISATKAGYRDAGAWYHVCYWYDSTIPDEGYFINGVRQEKVDGVGFRANYSSVLLENGYHLKIGKRQDDPSTLRGYLADFHCIDGQCIGPEHFALEASDGSYNPIRYDGEYGNNGFYLPFGENDPITEFKTPGEHSYTVPSGVNELDILLVGGGGGGGFQGGGGGGAGGVEYHANVPVTPGQVIPLTVGEGGLGKKVSSGTVAQNGGSTSILSYSVPGGGGGGDSEGPADWKNGRDGACGGGTGNGAKNTPGIPGTGSMGGSGGSDKTSYVPPSNNDRACGGSGGGGMGGSGSTQKNNPDPPGSTTCSGQGGPGVYYGDKFSDKYGDDGWFASGGSGGGYTNPNMSPLAPKGGGGGGKNSNYGGDREGDAMDGTGGGALGNHQATAPKPYQDNGGSGVVLIKPSNSSVITIGSDKSGNGNTFETYGLTSASVVADCPVNNYCTLNPVGSFANTSCGGILSNGNLDFFGLDSSKGGGYPDAYGTIPVSGGKWYFEVDAKTIYGGAYFGIVDPSTIVNTAYPMNNVGCVSWNPAESGGFIRVDGVDTAYGIQASDGDILGVAIDLEGQTLEGFINGTGYGKFDTSSASVGSGLRLPMIVLYGSAGLGQGDVSVNFGQRPWAYDPPSGYQAICTNNLPEVSIKPEEHFKAVTYSGNGTSQSIDRVGFEPSLAWIKSRSVAGNHRLHNVITYGGPISGGSSGIKYLHSDTADKETSSSAKTLTSLDSDGFSLYGDGADTNQSGSTYVSWNFKGGPVVTNNDGSIPSQVSANKDMGFSVVKWQGQGAVFGETVGHGLGAVPKLILQKILTKPYGWMVGSDELDQSTSWDSYLVLNETQASIRNTQIWETGPNSSVFHIGDATSVNEAGQDMIAYCFANSPMLHVGSYVGNGSADGAFVALPFKPALVLSKSTNSAGNWSMIDSKRDPYNVAKQRLYADISNAESPGNTFDLLSNGFKCRESGGPNVGSVTFLYLAIAEEAFKIARGR